MTLAGQEARLLAWLGERIGVVVAECTQHHAV